MYDAEPFVRLRGPGERPTGAFIAPYTEAPVSFTHYGAMIVGGTVAGGADEVGKADETIKREARILVSRLPRHGPNITA